MDAEISDLDSELIALYKGKIGAEDVDTEQMLRARGFIKDKWRITSDKCCGTSFC